MFVYLREALRELIYSANGSKIREFQQEDQILKPLLNQHVISGNGKRVLFSSAITLPVAMIFAIVLLVTMNGDNVASSIIGFCGCLALIAASVFSFAPIKNQLRKRMCDWEKLEQVIYIYWGAFSAGFFLIVLGKVFFLKFNNFVAEQ